MKIIWCMMYYVDDRCIINVWWLKEYMMTSMVSREYVDDRGIRNVWWSTRMNDES